MQEKESKTVVGITSSGIAIYLPFDGDLKSKLTKKDLAEAVAIFEFLFRQINQDTQLHPFALAMQMIQFAISQITIQITVGEAQDILMTKTDDEFLRYGGKLVFQEFK